MIEFEYKVGDLVICEGNQDIYMFLGVGGWPGWGEFVKMDDGSTCQMALIMCSKW